MASIIEIQVFYRTKDSGEIESIEQPPSSQDTAAIKLDVAKIVEKIKEGNNAEYWYMVVKVKKSDGGFAYRTMIPKTLI